MIEYRALSAADCESVAVFAMAGLPSSSHRVSPEKVRAVVQHFHRSTDDFHLVAWMDGRVVGAIAAAVSEMLFHERCEAIVVMCQARGPAGVGAELIRRLKAWADREFRVRRVVFPVELGARRGMARLLAQCGFNQVQQVCTFNKE